MKEQKSIRLETDTVREIQGLADKQVVRTTFNAYLEYLLSIGLKKVRRDKFN